MPETAPSTSAARARHLRSRRSSQNWQNREFMSKGSKIAGSPRRSAPRHHRNGKGAVGPRLLYTLALWLLLPYIFLRLLWRARKQPEYLQHIGERFGCYSVQSDPAG